MTIDSDLYKFFQHCLKESAKGLLKLSLTSLEDELSHFYSYKDWVRRDIVKKKLQDYLTHLRTDGKIPELEAINGEAWLTRHLENQCYEYQREQEKSLHLESADKVAKSLLNAIQSGRLKVKSRRKPSKSKAKHKKNPNPNRYDDLIRQRYEMAQENAEKAMNRIIESLDGADEIRAQVDSIREMTLDTLILLQASPREIPYYKTVAEQAALTAILTIIPMIQEKNNAIE